MPHHVVDKVADALNSHAKSVRGSKILVLGIAYKRDIDDIRESPALDVMAVLLQKGAARELSRSVRAAAWRRANGPAAVDMASVPLTDATLADADCVVIITDHKVFDYAQIVEAGAADRGHAQRDQDDARARVQAWARRRRRRSTVGRPFRAGWAPAKCRA